MSRAYWVKLTSAVSETIDASDKAVHKIDLESVIPEDEMEDILKGALERNGWEDSGDGTYTKTGDDGVTLTWNLEDMTVEATVRQEQQVTRDVQVEGRGYDQGTARREAERLLKQREQAARDAIGAESEKLQRELAKQLGDNEQERMREINGVLQETYAEALKRKARRLGNVTSVQESSDGDEYSLTITISE